MYASTPAGSPKSQSIQSWRACSLGRLVAGDLGMAEKKMAEARRRVVEKLTEGGYIEAGMATADEVRVAWHPMGVFDGVILRGALDKIGIWDFTPEMLRVLREILRKNPPPAGGVGKGMKAKPKG